MLKAYPPPDQARQSENAGKGQPSATPGMSCLAAKPSSRVR